MKRVKAWCVFSDGELLWMPDPYYVECRQLQAYKTRAEARRTAEDIRRVEIRVLPSKRRKK